MKPDRKSQILSTARDLFNEHGYSAVSMRNIADALHISVGNLTYHYKKKEDLAEAIILEKHKSYRKFEPPQSLEALNRLFDRILKHQEANVYYFRHYAELAEISPRVYQMQTTILQDLYESLKTAFENLHCQGFLKEDALSNQTTLLIQAILSICIYGAPFLGLSRINCLWSLIYPLLTEKGLADYRKLCRESPLPSDKK